MVIPTNPNHGRPVRVIIDDLILLKDERRTDDFQVLDSAGNIFIFKNEQARYEFVDGEK